MRSRQATYDTESVRKLFDEMAATYGYVNLISSFGFTARWRHQTVAGLPLDSANSVVDLMSGMGELWASLTPSLKSDCRITGVDLSPEMARRSATNWTFPVEVLVQDVLEWQAPLPRADIVLSSFGLKTFNHDQQKRLAETVAKLLKPGGVYSFVEISIPSALPLRLAFMFYLKWLIPVIGWLLLGNPDCYRMLWAYANAFGNSTYFKGCLLDAGLEAEAVSYFFGCATGVRGRKPS